MSPDSQNGNAKSTLTVAADGATLLLTLCAIVLAVYFVWERVTDGEPGQRQDEQVSNWQRYASGGARIGPRDAPVTIVEFGDYECPFCAQFNVTVMQVLQAFPDQVAFVYRHFPLERHPNSYRAARIAECALEQSVFPEVHTLLFETEDLGALELDEMAQLVAVDDSVAFVTCSTSTAEVPGIERDLALAAELDVSVTPTVLVNDMKLGMTPDSARLFDLVLQHIP